MAGGANSNSNASHRQTRGHRSTVTIDYEEGMTLT